MSETELPNQSNGCSEHPIDYLNKAAEACADGDFTLGLHLYLAAYEKAMSESPSSQGMAVAALREAWHLACDLKERSMAEHVFEKLEPYLSGEEISQCALTLQNLALERLEEYGFSREDLQDMAEAISQDFMGGDASVVKVEHFSIPGAGVFGFSDQIVADVVMKASDGAAQQEPIASVDSQTAAPAVEAPLAVEGDAVARVAAEEPVAAKESGERPVMGPAKVFNPYDLYPESSEGKSWRCATNVGSGWNESVGFDGTTVFDSRFKGFSPVRPSHDLEDDAPADASAGAPQVEPASSEETGSPDAPASDDQASANASAPGAPAATPAGADEPRFAFEQALASVPPPGVRAPIKSVPAPQAVSPAPAGARRSGFQGLVGYDDTVSIMREYGVGLQGDLGFASFVDMMNRQHGLDRMPAADSMLFRAPAIEDAARFAEATAEELGLPVLRMSMEENFQGMPLLCVTTDGSNRPRMNRQQNRFQGPAVLYLEDLDLWAMPDIPENIEGGMQAFVVANMSRGAREAMNLIRASVEDPDVFVIATASMSGEVDPFFYDVLEPLTVVDIGFPTERERAAIWSEIMHDHPSTRGLDLDDLVRYSEGLARFDLYMAARDAVEEAYKLGLVKRTFVPVTAENMFDKLAVCQPIDSDGYKALADKVVADFVSGLDDLEGLLGGAEG